MAGSSSSAGTAIWDLRMESWVNRPAANRQNFDREEINNYFHYASINAPCPDNPPK